MKVFISHSSHDKWAARWISKDLSALGVETFLDEKDLETGQSIDDEIGAQLKECDEILVLLSPTALKSHWVFIEVGGAKALGKRLIPILLDVAMNEVPAPISKHLARDINDIETYYGEVEKRLAGKAPPPKPRRRKRVLPIERRPSLKKGERVRIANLDELSEEMKQENPAWVDEMDQYAGKVATVSTFDPSDGWTTLDIDDGSYKWLNKWLAPLKK